MALEVRICIWLGLVVDFGMGEDMGLAGWDGWVCVSLKEGRE